MSRKALRFTGHFYIRIFAAFKNNRKSAAYGEGGAGKNFRGVFSRMFRPFPTASAADRFEPARHSGDNGAEAVEKAVAFIAGHPQNVACAEAVV